MKWRIAQLDPRLNSRPLTTVARTTAFRRAIAVTVAAHERGIDRQTDSALGRRIFP
jgi:hypothetical protein